MGDELDTKLGKVLVELRDDLAKMSDEPEALRIADARTILADENPDALWPDGFDDAFVGIARRCGQPALAAFSEAKAIALLMKRDGMTCEEADEHLSFNVIGSWVGPGTPIWIDDVEYD